MHKAFDRHQRRFRVFQSFFDKQDRINAEYWINEENAAVLASTPPEPAVENAVVEIAQGQPIFAVIKITVSAILARMTLVRLAYPFSLQIHFLTRCPCLRIQNFFNPLNYAVVLIVLVFILVLSFGVGMIMVMVLNGVFLTRVLVF
ncbi:MAG: hypothetical protein LUP96_05185 [Methylococcaceae bacterium]|nr:hypothetical protein [Methylococcaceae bacterium]